MSKLSKNVKILIFSAIGLVVLGAVTAVLLLFPVKTETDTAEEDAVIEETAGDVVFTDKTLKEIESVKITNTEGTFNITALSGNDTAETPAFLINELVLSNAPLNSASLNSMLSYLSGITAKQLVEENAEDLEKYGLLTPSASAEIKFTDGTEAAFCIGVSAPTGSFNYIRRNGSNDVYIAASYTVSGLLNSQFDYVKTQVMAEYDTENQPTVLKLTVTKPDGDITIVEALPETSEGGVIKTFNTHKFVQPITAELDSTASQSLIYGMYGLTAEKAVWSGMDVLDYELSGLNEPSCVVEMQVGGKVYTLSIGLPVVEEAEDGTKALVGYYGTFSEVPNVLYLFPQSSLPWLNIDYEALMAKLFLMPYIYSVSDLIVETQEKSLHFTITESEEEFGDDSGYDFYLDGERIEDEKKFKTLYQYLISARAESLYTAPAEMPLLARYTYKYKDSVLPDDVVELYESDDRKIIIYLNGSPLYKCRAMYATRLIQNIDAFLSGGEINTSW